MPETLKKLREPAALAAVVFAGLVVLVGIINLLAPPSTGGSSVPFADRAYDQTTAFLSLNVAAAVAFAVYLANHVGPAVAKARLITLAALVEVGLAALFGVITALAQFGASGVDGESKLLRFLEAAGGAAVVAAAGLFTWLAWQALAPATSRAPSQTGGAFIGGNWPGRSGNTGTGTGAGNVSAQQPGGQQYGQPAPPPGGFGWTPQQSAQASAGQPGQPGQSSPTAFGQQTAQLPGQIPGQAAAGYAQPSAQPEFGASQPFGTDRTQMLPPVQSGQPGQPPQPGQSQPGMPSAQPAYGQPPQPAHTGQTGPQPPFGQPSQPGHSGQTGPQPPFGQPSQPGHSGQTGPQPPFGQPPQLGQQIGQATVVSGSGSHQIQPPLPPTMQGYAAESSPWSPSGPGAGGQQGIPQHPGSAQPTQQIPPTRPEDEDQRPSPFQIGDWRSE